MLTLRVAQSLTGPVGTMQVHGLRQGEDVFLPVLDPTKKRGAARPSEAKYKGLAVF